MELPTTGFVLSSQSAGAGHDLILFETKLPFTLSYIADLISDFAIPLSSGLTRGSRHKQNDGESGSIALGSGMDRRIKSDDDGVRGFIALS